MARRIIKIIRVVWVTAGLSFFLWMAYSTQSRGVPDAVLQSDPVIAVSESSQSIDFSPVDNRRSTGVVFYPGALIDPKAYAPMAHRLAEAGFPIHIVKLPLRSAIFAGQEATVLENTRRIIEANPSVQRWVLGGHSRGAAIASRFAHDTGDLFTGLVLIGTTHPKEAAFDLSDSDLLVMKICATKDGLASVPEVKETSKFLPADTLWVEIAGGNHAQFGYYGTQLGDGRADISREKQQEMTVSAFLSLLDAIDK